MTLIRGGLVFDGTPDAGEKLDVLIDGPKIVHVGRVDTNSQMKVIDAGGLCVCPGFIDIHGHSDLEILRDPSMKAKVRQGITTELGGNCGIGVFPIPKPENFPGRQICDILGPYDDFSWHDYAGYKERTGESPYSLFMLQGHSMLRCAAMEGNPNRPATENEIRKMEGLLQESLDQGCLGLSTGLYYAPCIYASREELLRLSRVVSRNSRFLCVHHRCEGSQIISSLEEILSIAEEAEVKLEISHLKIIGKKNQGLLDRVFGLLEENRTGFDQYPYTYGNTSLCSLLPPDLLALGEDDRRKALLSPGVRKQAQKEMAQPRNWDSITELAGFEDIFISQLSCFPGYIGKSLLQISEERNQDPYESLFDLLSEETGNAMMIDVTETGETLRRIFCHPLGVFGTDALYTGGKAHPRSYNAAPHCMNRDFLKQMGKPLEFCINRMTGKTALRFGMTDRGFIRDGMRADLVIFDRDTIGDCSTIREPEKPPVGISRVFIGGEEKVFR